MFVIILSSVVQPCFQFPCVPTDPWVRACTHRCRNSSRWRPSARSASSRSANRSVYVAFSVPVAFPPNRWTSRASDHGRCVSRNGSPCRPIARACDRTRQSRTTCRTSRERPLSSPTWRRSRSRCSWSSWPARSCVAFGTIRDANGPYRCSSRRSVSWAIDGRTRSSGLWEIKPSLHGVARRGHRHGNDVLHA